MVIISHNKSKKQPFSVTNKSSENNEKLSSTETFTTRQAAWKNILAHMKLYSSPQVSVQDNSLKKPAVYILQPNGLKTKVS